MKLSGKKLRSLEWGCAKEKMAGQVHCGDHCLVKEYPAGALLGVIDGIGHGKEAADAAQAAVDMLEISPEQPVISLMQWVHERLRSTRGVVMTLASFNFVHHTLTWLGVGNVQGTLLRSYPAARGNPETVLLRGGVIGHQLPPLKAEVIPVARGDLLILATDGIDSGYTPGISNEEMPLQISERILKQYSKGNDDSLVMVARYLGGNSEEKTGHVLRSLLLQPQGI